MNGALTAATRLVGLIGWPVDHSLSPQMHNAAFRSLGLDWAYLALPVRPEQVPAAVRGLAALGFAGANVTVPHKTAVLAEVDALTPAAIAAGAVNTLVVRPDGSVLGDNTDGAGFLADLEAHNVGPVGSEMHALVLGAGGAARAVVAALVQSGAQVTVANRTRTRAEQLCLDLAGVLPSAANALRAVSLSGDLAAAADEATLVVNATSLGLHSGDPLPWDLAVPFRPDQIVYDLIYHRPTPLLALANKSGARAIGGLGMLVAQGARAFELWTGQPAPLEVMRRAIEPELAAREMPSD